MIHIFNGMIPSFRGIGAFSGPIPKNDSSSFSDIDEFSPPR
jgi:hypothetical protein